MNYYEILEVSSNASKEVIKNAYRALIKKYHPDSYQGDKEYAQELLKKINEAYETLIDDNKRLLYDYDNGFKVDPNAPNIVEVPEQETEVTKHEEPEKKVSLKEKILENKKKCIIIGVLILFVLAFIIGSILAGSDDDEHQEKENETIEKEQSNGSDSVYSPNYDYKYDKNKDKNNNNSSNYNYSYDTPQNQQNNNVEVNENKENNHEDYGDS